MKTTFLRQRDIVINVSNQTSIAIISFAICTKNIIEIWYAVLFEKQKSATRKSFGKDNEGHGFSLCRETAVLFQGHFRERRDATRRDAKRTPPLKSQLFCLPRARARIGAGDLFSDDRGVPGATFTRGLSRGCERSVRGLIISYFV